MHDAQAETANAAPRARSLIDGEARSLPRLTTKKKLKVLRIHARIATLCQTSCKQDEDPAVSSPLLRSGSTPLLDNDVHDCVAAQVCSC